MWTPTVLYRAHSPEGLPACLQSPGQLPQAGRQPRRGPGCQLLLEGSGERVGCGSSLRRPLCISTLPSPSCGPGCWGWQRAGTHMASSPPGQPAAGGVPGDRWGRETESRGQPLEPPHLWPPLGHTCPVSAPWTLTQEAWMGGMNRCPDRGPQATRGRWSRHPLAPAFAVKMRSEATGAAAVQRTPEPHPLHTGVATSHLGPPWPWVRQDSPGKRQTGHVPIDVKRRFRM